MQLQVALLGSNIPIATIKNPWTTKEPLQLAMNNQMNSPMNQLIDSPTYPSLNERLYPSSAYHQICNCSHESQPVGTGSPQNSTSSERRLSWESRAHVCLKQQLETQCMAMHRYTLLCMVDHKYKIPSEEDFRFKKLEQQRDSTWCKSWAPNPTHVICLMFVGTFHCDAQWI